MNIKSDKWQLVQEKIDELRVLVDNNWRNQEWSLAVLGEKVITTVERSRDSAAEMRCQTAKLAEVIDDYDRRVSDSR